MDGEINDYLTIADTEGLLKIISTSTEDRPLVYNAADLIGTADTEIPEKDKNKKPDVQPGGPPEDWDDPLYPK